MAALRSTLLAALVLSACGAVRGELIKVAFPAERQRLPAVSETYVIGSAAPGRTELLYVNGATTAVHRTGGFIAMVPVKPGVNTLTLSRGGTRLVRTFTVAEPTPPAPPKTEKPIAGDDDERLGEPGAWRTTGRLFANRVRSEIDGGDSLFYLPQGFVFRGAEVKGSGWIAVWLENVRGFLPRKTVAPVTDGRKTPPKGLIAPNPLDGFPERPPYRKPPSAVRICVDAGHGGSDVGALSPHGWYEKDVNLMQARALRDALEARGFHVVMTRDGDSFPSLLDRPQTAYDERVDAFISIHHNSSPVHRDPRLVRHTTTYAATSNGLDLARCVQKHVGQVMAPVQDAGAQMKSLAVCRNPAVPSCLVEVDFINLPDGEVESWNPARQRKVADAIVRGVLDWMTPEPEPEPDPDSEPEPEASQPKD